MTDKLDEMRENDIKASIKKLYELKREYGEDRFTIVTVDSKKTMRFIENNPEHVSFRGSYRVYDSKLIDEVKVRMQNGHNLLLVGDPTTDEMTVYTVYLSVASEEDVVKEGNAGGCFIATAIYGSYESREVIALRRFRDETMLTSELGKRVVGIYYFISPPIARLLCRRYALNRVFKTFILDPIVTTITKK